MKPNLKARLFLVCSVIFLSLIYALPSSPLYQKIPGGVRKVIPSRKINLGLDLQGGTHLVLEVDSREAIDEAARKQILDVTQILEEEKIDLASVTPDEDYPGRLIVKLEKTSDLDAAVGVLEERYGGRYNRWEFERVSENRILMKVSKKEIQEIEDALQQQAIEVIRNRIDEFGVSEPTIQPQGRRRIIVQLPGLKEPERAKALLGRTSKLTFHLASGRDKLWELLTRIDEEKKTDLRSYLLSDEVSGVNFAVPDIEKVGVILEREDIKEFLPDGYKFNFGKVGETRSGSKYQGLYVIKEKPELGGEHLKHAYVGYQRMFPVVHIEFKRSGALIFEKVTGENKGEPLAILLDDVVQSAPIIRDKITYRDSPFIEGRFTPDEANDLAIMLRAGALPASIRMEYEQTVGPSLGKDSIEKGVRAAVVGTFFVLLFMAVYYILCGLLADFALCINLVIILAILAGLGGTLTLPGIAGIILTMGMSVDANVIIFERMREEFKSGKSLRAGIAAGYGKAFRTILDSNVTTLIAALVLFQFGTGPIRGFAVTLSIGIVASMFTAIVVTRLILDLLSGRRRFRRLFMLELIRRAQFGFVEKRRVALGLSLLVIVFGCTFIAKRGADNFGIDFRGGTLLLRTFRNPVEIERIRKTLLEIGEEKSMLQQFDAGKGVIIRSPGEEGIAGKVDQVLKKEFGSTLMDPEDFGQTNFVGPTVGRDLRRQARLSIFFALLGIIIYISWRFQFKFAVAAIAALIHDVLVTLGLFSFSGREITLPVIAAILTIIGYSLNDTIVVFDRIRENMRLLRKESFPAIVNKSINETLSRTILTSITTLMVVVSLYFLGGEVIHDFAFAMLVGVIAGTYSSIFVASPILVQWHKKTKKA